MAATGDEAAFEAAFKEMLEMIPEEDQGDFYDEFADGESRVGGYPCFVQGPTECYEMGDKTVLLLQLDCDDESVLMFGDAGN